MEQHQLIFHVGTPKTGSTALQKFLYNKREALEQVGWVYPNLFCDSYRTFANGAILYDIYHQRQVQDNDSLKRRWEESVQHILQQLELYHVIISDERFWILEDIGNFLAAFKRHWQNIKVVVYLRRQDRYLEAGWNQQVKILDYLKKELSRNFIEIPLAIIIIICHA